MMYTPTLPLRRAALTAARNQQATNPSTLTLTPFARPFSTTPTALAGSQPPPPNMPPASQGAGKNSSPANDSQSSASTATQSSSDEHPAKQPDPQQEVDRSTGFGNVKGPVKGGKEGLGARSDRDDRGN